MAWSPSERAQIHLKKEEATSSSYKFKILFKYHLSAGHFGLYAAAASLKWKRFKKEMNGVNKRWTLNSSVYSASDPSNDVRLEISLNFFLGWVIKRWNRVLICWMALTLDFLQLKERRLFPLISDAHCADQMSFWMSSTRVSIAGSVRFALGWGGFGGCTPL